MCDLIGQYLAETQLFKESEGAKEFKYWENLLRKLSK